MKPSASRAPDPVYVSMFGDVNTSMGSGALDGLEKGDSLTAKSVYPGGIDPSVTPTAEAQDAPPVASGMDAFELVGLMHVADGRLSETRFRRAMDAYRKAVDRE